jgi:hypothetical protein
MLRRFFFRRALRPFLGPKALKRHTVPYAQCERIALLFDATEASQIVQVQRFSDQLRKDGKQVQLLGFLPKSESESVHNFSFYSKKQINWFGKPGGEYVASFLKQPADLLICVWKEPHKSLEWIATAHPASWRIAPFEESLEHVAEFFIKLDEQRFDLPSYFSQVEHFLQIIRTSSYEPKRSVV